jgi:hypothetical protein
MASSSHSSAHHINIDIKVWQMILNYFCNGQKETAWAGLRNRRRNTGLANEAPKAFGAVILLPLTNANGLQAATIQQRNTTPDEKA